ncbi:MAG: MFS transporter [Candidatus Methanomethylophilaceae archaeon]|nr:MFS transporter [Candidatus Methanomethylophilaceae archaeon]
MTGFSEAVSGRDFAAAWFACFLMTVVFFAHFTAMPSYSTDVLGTGSAVGGLVAGVFIAGDIAGRLLIRTRIWSFGPGRMCAMAMGAGTLLSAVHLLCDDPAVVVISNLAHGATYGIAELSVFSHVSVKLPDDIRGRGLGYFTLSYSLAMAIGPLMTIGLVNTGRYDEVFLLGLVASGLSMCSALLLGRVGGVPQVYRKERRRYILRRTAPVSTVSLIFLIAYSGLLTFIAPLGVSLGIEGFTHYFYVVMSVATVVSRLFIVGRYDEGGPDRVLIPLFAAFVASLLAIGCFPTGAVLLAAAFPIGLALAGIQAIGQAMVVDGLPPEDHSMAIAVFQIAVDSAYLVGPVVNGLSVDMLEGGAIFLVMAVIGAASMAAYVFYRRRLQTGGMQGREM